jgi:predicted kinase
MRPKPLLIIISGLPAAGKTHLSTLLAKELHLPLFGRDNISEILFDRLELQASDWSTKQRRTSYELLYWTMSEMLKAGQSLIVESSFDANFAKRRFAGWHELYDFEPLQIIVTADKHVLLDRYRRRLQDPQTSSKSHPVHFAYLTYERYRQKLEAGRWAVEPLDVGGEAWHIDTSDPNTVDYADIVARISSKLAL